MTIMKSEKNNNIFLNVNEKVKLLKFDTNSVSLFSNKYFL